MRTRTLLAGLALSAGLLFAQGTPEKDRIYDQVRIKIANDRDVGGNAVDLVVDDNGQVTLKGKVAKESQKVKAEKIAKKVKGVKSVVNQLVVESR